MGALFRGGGASQMSDNGHGGTNGHSDGSAESGALSRWRRREPSVAQMREGYHRVVELMDALEEHFRKQDERSARLSDSMERVAGTLGQLEQVQRVEQGHVQTIADQVANVGEHAASISASLAQMPKSMQVQAEAVRTMLQRLEISQESDTQLMHSLQQLGRAVDTLGTSATVQVQTLERLNSAEREQHAALTTFVQEQSRRFLLVIIVATVLVVGALGALTVAILMQLGR
jgi:hypothetical protein